MKNRSDQVLELLGKSKQGLPVYLIKQDLGWNRNQVRDALTKLKKKDKVYKEQISHKLIYWHIK